MMETHNCWWKERVFYEIYPRSFQDSNGDGIGDLRGIISRLDYLQWLGVGAVWLCPIYDSPNADMGYDIRNYESVMAEFGTMEDFDELVSQLHRRDIKLVMDLVVNHTSDEHPWFLEARTAKDSPYRDYYIWRDGKDGWEPNNWASFFTSSAWTYDETTAQWYLHLFSGKQPDLNWENPELRQEIYGMMNRWLDRGVDGFRMDVISLLAKHPQLPDGKGSGYVFSPEYFAFQPRLHDYLREMRRACFDGRDCMCVGETSFVTTQNAGSVVDDGRELDMLFQFDVMDMDSGETKWDARPFDLMRFKQIISAWQTAIGWNTLFWGNHDQPRLVSRFGCTRTETLRRRSATCLATAMYLLRGTPFLYQGEEIGMTNCPFPDISELRDVESLNLLRQAAGSSRMDWAWRGVRSKGRDNARTPCSGMRRPMEALRMEHRGSWSIQIRGKSMWLRPSATRTRCCIITGRCLLCAESGMFCGMVIFRCCFTSTRRYLPMRGLLRDSKYESIAILQTGMPRCRKPCVKGRCF